MSATLVQVYYARVWISSAWLIAGGILGFVSLIGNVWTWRRLRSVRRQLSRVLVQLSAAENLHLESVKAFAESRRTIP
jgi:hypothetical protein